jgi:hypothetical protein
MKRYLFYGFMLAIGLIITSCNKDTGNYVYHSINQVTFSNIDTVKGYQVLFDDSLSIAPTLVLSQDKAGSGNYKYEWSFHLGSPAAPPERDSVISISKDLKTRINLPPGQYSLQYRVTDNGTGVTFQVRTNVNVTTDVYEGYMLLNNVGGQSRLDMISYNNGSGSFTQYIDVLKKMGSTVPMNGTPYQVYCTQYTLPNITPENYGIFILNSAGCNRVNQETFAYDPSMNIRNLFIGDVPASFIPQHMFNEGAFGLAYPVIYLFEGGNVYSYSVFNGYAFHYSPLNVYTASGTPFNVAPYGVSTGSTGAFYNSDKKNFVTAASYNSTSLTDAGANFKYPTGLDLVYMEKDYNNNTFAILKDPATSKKYLLKFPIGGVQNYYQEIVGTDIANATNFALSPTFGYLFYSAGGKVYEYDPSLQTSILMVDKSPANITYLNFQHFFNRTNSTVNKNYSTWANYLSVASYGAADDSGTFELYSVPPVNGQIVKMNGWNGFGKIVSVSYRER